MLAQELAERTGIPVRFHAFARGLTNALSISTGALFAMDIYMKKPWEIEPTEE